MNLTEENVRTSYLRGVNQVLGKGMVTPKMERIVHDIQLEKDADYSKMYYSLTRGLIDGMSSFRCNLSEDLKCGFAESIALKIWQSGDFSSRSLYSDGFNERSVYNEHMIEYLIGDYLVNTIGVQESSICMLKNPDLMGKLLGGVAYDGGSLLSYLNRQITKAKTEFSDCKKNFLDTDSETIECCLAISDCADQLRLPAERLKKQKVLSKLRKFVGKDNEGQEL